MRLSTEDVEAQEEAWQAKHGGGREWYTKASFFLATRITQAYRPDAKQNKHCALAGVYLPAGKCLTICSKECEWRRETSDNPSLFGPFVGVGASRIGAWRVMWCRCGKEDPISLPCKQCKGKGGRPISDQL